MHRTRAVGVGDGVQSGAPQPIGAEPEVEFVADETNPSQVGIATACTAGAKMRSDYTATVCSYELQIGCGALEDLASLAWGLPFQITWNAGMENAG